MPPPCLHLTPLHSLLQLPTRADPGDPARPEGPEKDSNLQLTWGHGTQGQELGPDC